MARCCERLLIGLTFCPGKQHHGLSGVVWRRDLNADIETIQDWEANAWLNLMEDRDVLDVKLNPAGFADAIQNAGIMYFHMPIEDGWIPEADRDLYWRSQLSPELLERLKQGQKLLIHCRGGLGRTGMIAARLLVDLGCKPSEAVAWVRRVRPGAIENIHQENWAIE